MLYSVALLSEGKHSPAWLANCVFSIPVHLSPAQSWWSLEAMFPDDEDRKCFLRHVVQLFIGEGERLERTGRVENFEQRN